MKKIYALLFAASALFAATSCQEEIVDPTLEDASIKGGMTITATVGAETKTVLGDNGVSTFWTDKDMISVFDSDKDGNNRKFSVVTKNVEFPASKATFALDPAEEFVWPQNNQPDPLIVALYPYQEDAYCDFFYYDRNYITGLEIPVVQTAVKNAFDPTATFALATGKFLTKDELQFTNLYSLLRITLKEEGVTAVKVTVEGGNIAGKAKVQLNLAEGPVFAGGTLTATDEGSESVTLVCEEGCFEPNEKYYIAIAPVTYTNIQVEIQKGETWSKVKDTTPGSPKKLEANHIYNISNLDDPKTIADGVYLNEEGIYEISNEAGLFWLAEQVNAGESFAGKNVVLVADIDLKNAEWTPIGTETLNFEGNFDGQNKVVKNLKITTHASITDSYGKWAYAGLFGVTCGAENQHNSIKNIIIENVEIDSDGDIVAAAVAYPYYTDIENITVRGDINIKGGNYTSGVLAYTRRCVNAKDLTIEGNKGSIIVGDQTIGGVISDIQMNGGLTAVYSNFNASGLTITGNKSVGGISGIIAKQTLDGATVKNVTIVCEDARKGIVSGALGEVSTIKNVTVDNVTGADKVVGATYSDGLEVFVKDDTYSPYKVASSAEELKSAVATDGKVVLAADIVMSEILTISKNVILDGNGKKLTSSAGRAINVSGADDVTIKNLTIVASGERAINIIQNTKKVTIENVTATAANYAVNVASSAPGVEAIIKNSTLTGLNVVNVASPDAAITIEKTALVCKDQNMYENYACLALNMDAVGAEIIATDVTFDISGDSKQLSNGAEGASVSINGRECPNNVVAIITYPGPYYHSFETLAGAVEYAKYGETVTMMSNVALSEILTINKSITLNGNGYSVTSTAGRTFNIETTGEVTIKNLTINAAERAVNIINKPATVNLNNVTAIADNNAVMIATSAGAATLNVTNSDFTGLAVINVAGAGAQATIADTKITNVDANPAENYGAITISATAAGSKVTVSGGQIVVADDSKKAYIFPADATVEGVDDIGCVVVTVGDAGYDTLKEAVEDVKSGETINFVRDVAISETISVDKSVTLNLNGFNLDASSNTSRPFNLSGGTLTINAAGSNIKTGTYGFVNIPSGDVALVLNGGVYTANTDNGAFIKVRGAGKVALTLNDVNYTDVSNDGYVTNIQSYTGDDDNITITVTGGSYSAAGGFQALTTNSSIKDATIVGTSQSQLYGAVEVVGNSTIQGCNITSAGYAISTGFGAKVTVVNCVVNSDLYAYNVYGTGGTIDVTGGSYNGQLYIYDLQSNAKSDSCIIINDETVASKVR